MRSVPGTDNVIPFRRPAAARQGAINAAFGAGEPPRSRSRSDQRNLMDAVYATGSLRVPADDRETKLIASRLQVYGFLLVEEIGANGTPRRLRPSEAIRARTDFPWRLSKARYGAGTGLAVTIPAVDNFLFDLPSGLPA